LIRSAEPECSAAPLLPQLFEAVAARHANRVAIDIPPGSGRPSRTQVTYSELRRLAEAVAAASERAFSGGPGASGGEEKIVALLLSRHETALYAAQIGVLQCGAAFVCLDPRSPDDYLRRILADAAPDVLITNRDARARAEALIESPASSSPRPALLVVEQLGGCQPGSRAGVAVRPDQLAYLIYTSGTTGAPRAVMLEHRGIANLVASDEVRFSLGPGDRVAQCSSPAYDSSVEETWLAFGVGATLVPIDDETIRSGPDLAAWLRREWITTLCPAPTLLRSMGCTDPALELPELRLLYVGGEALPQDLADLWGAGRRLENGYGPTECTVTVVRGRVEPGSPVTIGAPVSGHLAWVLDERLGEVPDGQPGELCLAGPGLARGYRGSPELTDERFPVHPRFGRIYRTGDLVRRTSAGELEYLGRIDAQVKLRGYRIELTAVEAALAAHRGIRAAACCIQGAPGVAGGEQLVAHLVAESTQSCPDLGEIRDTLRRTLPAHMVPARMGWIPSLPMTAGGKLDRRALPELRAPEFEPPVESTGACSREEEAVLTAFAKALGLPALPALDADFFADLGGNSLTAVAVIRTLRASGVGRLTELAVRDLYETRTAASLAALAPSSPLGDARVEVPRPPGSARGRPAAATVLQAGWLLLVVVCSGISAAWLGFDLLPWLVRRAGLISTLAWLPVLEMVGLVGWGAGTVLLAAALKWGLVGRYREERVPAWTPRYVRHWIVAWAARAIPWRLLAGTAALPAVLRVLGARVGRGVHVHHGVDFSRGGWDLLEIGDGAVLCRDAAPRMVDLEDGELVLGAIRIGSGAVLGVRAGLSPGSSLGDGARLGPLAWVPRGCHIPAGEHWEGIPAAAPPHDGRPADPDLPVGGGLSPWAHAAVLIGCRAAAWLAPLLLPIMFALVAAGRVPDAEGRFLDWLEHPAPNGPWFFAGVLAPVLALPVRLLLQALLPRVLGPVPSGWVGQCSLDAIRISLRVEASEAAGAWLSGSLLWPAWLRLAGMRIGRGCEISTLIDVVPETVTLGDECFLADGIYFCGPERVPGAVRVPRSRFGGDTFLANHAVVPAGHCWPAGLFIGVSTLADPDRVRPHTGWFGSPPMELPQREVVAEDRTLTHRPGPLRYANRLGWELARFTIPVVPLLSGYAAYAALAAVRPRVKALAFLGAASPPALLLAELLLCLAVIALKWLLLGRVRPGRHPLWSCWCSRWDFLYVAWHHWARGLLLQLEGTLFLNAFLRLTGMKIGRGVLFGPGFAQVVDPDMLEVADGATVTSHFQAHSFEDRVLKIDRVRIGARASVGDHAVVFYGVEIGEGARLLPHTVVMKQEHLAPERTYFGAPARPS
jgi:non-ribosomal peptide synthetase-like protein